ncbi:MAG TPA: hypothetical protein VGB95_06800 [Chitinophagales bacterium]
METVTLKSLTEKLKNVSPSVLEKISDYADELLGTFKLSEKQKAHLLKQNEVPLEACTDAEKVYEDLKQKYAL